jgi:hypothetical protein
MRLALALTVMFISAAAVRAQAEPDKAAATQEANVAQKLYEETQYREAGAHFARAYELDPQAAYLFDAAQAYRFAKECASSARFYRQFLDVAKQAQVQNLDKVKRYLAEMDQCAKARTPSPEPPKVEPPKVEPPKLEVQPHPPPLEPLPAAPPADPGRTKRRVGLAIAGAGVAALAFGVFNQYEVSNVEGQRHSYFTMYCNTAAPCSTDIYNAIQPNLQHLDSRGDKYSTHATFGYAIGGAALIGGVALYMLGRGGNDAEHPVAIVPTRSGAMVTFSF